MSENPPTSFVSALAAFNAIARSGRGVAFENRTYLTPEGKICFFERFSTVVGTFISVKTIDFNVRLTEGERCASLKALAFALKETHSTGHFEDIPFTPGQERVLEEAGFSKSTDLAGMGDSWKTFTPEEDDFEEGEE